MLFVFESNYSDVLLIEKEQFLFVFRLRDDFSVVLTASTRVQIVKGEKGKKYKIKGSNKESKMKSTTTNILTFLCLVTDSAVAIVDSRHDSFPTKTNNEK